MDKLEQFKESAALTLFSRSRIKSIETGTCVICGGEAKEFKDTISKKEFSISGMCQTCQDKCFG